MNLKHIKTKACPYCLCNTIVRESFDCWDNKPRKHTNGQYWETREFACGYKTQWVPNFQREECSHECENKIDQEAKEFHTCKQIAIGTINRSRAIPKKMKEILVKGIDDIYFGDSLLKD